MKNVVVLDKKALLEIANGEKKFDNRKNNTGRPVNKKSARQARLAKQAFYADVNSKFVKGNQFEINGYVCNVSYIGRTKVQGFTYVLGKKVNIELNLKTLKFTK